MYNNLLNSIRIACNYGTTKRHPVCAISYTRNYYKYIDGTSLTVDKNIKYFSIKDSLPKKYSFIESPRVRIPRWICSITNTLYIGYVRDDDAI